MHSKSPMKALAFIWLTARVLLLRNSENCAHTAGSFLGECWPHAGQMWSHPASVSFGPEHWRAAMSPCGEKTAFTVPSPRRFHRPGDRESMPLMRTATPPYLCLPQSCLVLSAWGVLEFLPRMELGQQSWRKERLGGRLRITVLSHLSLG